MISRVLVAGPSLNMPVLPLACSTPAARPAAVKCGPRMSACYSARRPIREQRAPHTSCPKGPLTHRPAELLLQRRELAGIALPPQGVFLERRPAPQQVRGPALLLPQMRRLLEPYEGRKSNPALRPPGALPVEPGIQCRMQHPAEGTPVVTGWMDTLCCSLGCGLVEHGRAVHPYIHTGWWIDTGKPGDMLAGIQNYFATGDTKLLLSAVQKMDAGQRGRATGSASHNPNPPAPRDPAPPPPPPARRRPSRSSRA